MREAGGAPDEEDTLGTCRRGDCHGLGDECASGIQDIAKWLEGLQRWEVFSRGVPTPACSLEINFEDLWESGKKARTGVREGLENSLSHVERTASDAGRVPSATFACILRESLRAGHVCIDGGTEVPGRTQGLGMEVHASSPTTQRAKVVKIVSSKPAWDTEQEPVPKEEGESGNQLKMVKGKSTE